MAVLVTIKKNTSGNGLIGVLHELFDFLMLIFKPNRLGMFNLDLFKFH